MHMLNRSVLDRRTVLRGGAVALALPLLDAMTPAAYSARQRADAAAIEPRRMVLIHRGLGTYHQHLVPQTTGLRYEATRFLTKLEPYRGQFTLFSGMGHPGYPNSHGTEPAIFTGVPEFNERDLHNSISLDQVAARKVGDQTRAPSLALRSVWSQSLCWNEKGMPIPHEPSAAAVFRQMFVEGTPDEVRREMSRLEQGASILDDVRTQLKALVRRLGAADRDRIDLLTVSVREAEKQLEQQKDWSRKPKPTVPMTLAEVQKPAEHGFADQNKWLDLVHLLLQTDSTRVIVIGLSEQPRTGFPDLEIQHHDASHHGKDPAKIEQLCRYEDTEFDSFAHFLGRLVDTKENAGTLLDSTQVLFTSNLGDASAHSSTNLPVLLAGGGYRHQGHISFGGDTDNKPLCNLYVRMLQQMGVETDRFGSSTGVVGDIG